jgi:hypothetical protein
MVLACSADGALADTPVPSYSETAIDSPIPEATGFQGFAIALGRAGDVDRDGAGDIVASDTAQPVGGLAGAGRAWVFSGRTRQLLLTLTSPEPQAGAAFGRSVIGIGDVDGDGIPDLEAGAPNQNVYTGSGTGCGQPEPNGCNEKQGKVFVFSGADGHLLYSVADPVPQPNALFGRFYVAAPGDLDADGTPDFIVTAPGENAGAMTNSGAAYAINGKTGAMLYRLGNPHPEAAARFGNGIGDPGDVNGDGVGDVVIGAPGATSGGGSASQGRAYAFSGKTGALLQTFEDPAPQTPGPFGGPSFGADLGGHGAPGDVNGDGVRDVYVGATQQNVQGLDSAGQGYLFNVKDGSLIREVNSPSLQTNAGFGFAYDDAGDLNGDGTSDLLVGQFSSGNPNGYTSGAWVINPRTAGVLAAFPGTTNGPGDTLASTGDVNGDTCPDYFLGGPTLDAQGNAHQGRIIVELSQGRAPSCGLPASATPSVAALGRTSDTVAPGVSHFGLTINPFRVGGGTPIFGSAARKHRKGTTFRYTLTEAATVKIAISQRLAGRRKGSRCVAPTRSRRKAKKCTRVLSRGTLTRTSHQGQNSVAFSGRIGSKALRPGNYQATITATDVAKNTSKPKTISFRVVKR